LLEAKIIASVNDISNSAYVSFKDERSLLWQNFSMTFKNTNAFITGNFINQNWNANR
jgi:hypothetical protein